MLFLIHSRLFPSGERYIGHRELRLDGGGLDSSQQWFSPQTNITASPWRCVRTVCVSLVKMLCCNCQAVSRWWKNIIDLEQCWTAYDSWICIKSFCGPLSTQIYGGHHYSSPRAFPLEPSPDQCVIMLLLWSSLQQWEWDWSSSDLLNETLMDSCGKLPQRLIN